MAPPTFLFVLLILPVTFPPIVLSQLEGVRNSCNDVVDEIPLFWSKVFPSGSAVELSLDSLKSREEIAVLVML